MDFRVDDGIKEYFFPSSENAIDRSKKLIEWYGSTRELNDALRLYNNFSGSHGKDQKLPQMFKNSCVKYTTLRGQGVHFKQDILAILHRQFWEDFELKNDGLGSLAMAVLLKVHEDKLANTCEFVAFDEEQCDSLRENRMNFYSWNMLENKKPPKIGTFEKALTFLKDILPVEWDEEVHEPLKLKLKEDFNSLSRSALAENLNELIAIFKTYNDLIAKMPNLFLPASKNKSGQNLKAIRLFQDGKHWFLMKEEVDEVLGRPSQSDSTKIKTIEYFAVLRELDKDVELVQTPILRTKHRAQPIRDSQWGLCKLAVDCMFEWIYDALVGFELFQRIDESDWEATEEGFKMLEGYFHIGKKNTHFISMEHFRKIPTARNLFQFAKDRKIREVRDVRSVGFTSQDLMEELQFLELPRLFPSILDHVETVFKWVLREKSASRLRTCDMKDAVLHCQLICLMDRFPTIRSFIHEQNGCHRILHKKCCSTPAPSTRFQDSQYTKICLSDVKTGTKEEHTFLVGPNDLQLFYNVIVDSGHAAPGMKLCLIEGNLREQLHEEIYGKTVAQRLLLMKSFTNFANFANLATGHVIEKVFIRHINTTFMRRDETCVIFADELFDAIQYLLSKNGSKTQTEKLKSYLARWKWEGIIECGPKTMSLDQMAAVLEDLDMDKSLITVIPDIRFTRTVQTYLPTSNATFVTLYSPIYAALLTPSDAIFTIFHDCIGLWWDPELRKRLLNSMKDISMSPDDLHHNQFIEEIVHDFTDNSEFEQIKRDLYDLFCIINAEASVPVPMNVFLGVCKRTHLKFSCPESIGKEELDRTFVQAWKARLLLFWELCNQLFGEEHPDLKEHVRSAILTRAPINERMDEEGFQNAILNMTTPEFFNKRQMTEALEQAENDEVRIDESMQVLKAILAHSKQITPIDPSRIRLPYANENPVTSKREKRQSPPSTPRDVYQKMLKESGFTKEELRTKYRPTYTLVEMNEVPSVPSSPPSPTSLCDHGNVTQDLPTSASSSAGPPADQAAETPPHRQSKPQLLAELLQKQESLESQKPQDKKSNRQVSFANLKYVSKKNKKRIRNHGNKPRLLQRIQVTDRSPASNNYVCANPKCKRAKNLCKEKNAALMDYKERVEELEKEIRVLNRKIDSDAASKRTQESSEKMNELETELSESKQREGKLQKQIEELNANNLKRTHETEKKKMLAEFETMEKESDKQIQEAQNDAVTAQVQLSLAQIENAELQEKLEDALLQLRMSSATRWVYLKLRETEQTLRDQDPMKEIRKKAEKIIADSQNENDRDGAKQELDILKQAFLDFEKNLKWRIQALLENPERSDIEPMGQLPKTSVYFAGAYKRTLLDEVARLKNG